MLAIYSAEAGRIARTEYFPAAAIPAGAVWFDLYEPAAAEVKAVQDTLGLHVPTRDEMKEIEASSRLRAEDADLFMTTLVLAQTETERPLCSAITFILSRGKLATVRYVDPHPFRAFASQIQLRPGLFTSGETVLLGILDAVIDRSADILERIADEVNNLSIEVFGGPDGGGERRDLKELLRRVGHQGDLISKSRESLVSIGRMLPFLVQRAGGAFAAELRGHIDTLVHDTASLSDQATFLSNKVNFLLEATLGLINVEQNAIIKIFSVVAVVFMPPTLIASIYGMNFQWMPELSWHYGYPLSVLVMLASAVGPYLFFKMKGWL